MFRELVDSKNQVFFKSFTYAAEFKLVVSFNINTKNMKKKITLEKKNGIV